MFTLLIMLLIADSLVLATVVLLQAGKGGAIVHREIRDWFAGQDVTPADVRVLYGGSVKPSNAAELLSEPELGGVLVGGASLDPVSWGEICSVLD